MFIDLYTVMFTKMIGYKIYTYSQKDYGNLHRNGTAITKIYSTHCHKYVNIHSCKCTVTSFLSHTIPNDMII